MLSKLDETIFQKRNPQHQVFISLATRDFIVLRFQTVS